MGLPYLAAPLLLVVAGAAAILLAITVPAAAEELTDGYSMTRATYVSPITFNVNNLLNNPVVPATVTFSQCKLTSYVTFQGIGVPRYVTMLNMQWKDTEVTGTGSWKLLGEWPNAYMHFYNTKSTAAMQVPFFSSNVHIRENFTLFIDKADIVYSSSVSAISIRKPSGQDQVNIELYSTLYMRDITVTKCDIMLATDVLNIATESQFFLEDSKSVDNTGPVVSFMAVTISSSSAFVLNRVSGDFHFARIFNTTVDSTSVFAWVDISNPGNLLFFPESFKGPGVYLFSRIELGGSSGLRSFEPEDNTNLWVSMKLKGVLQTDEELSVVPSRFNMNSANHLNWDGTTGPLSECLSAFAAVPGRASHGKINGVCAPTCNAGYLPPACTKPPVPSACSIDGCARCFRNDASKCVLCFTPHILSQANDRCDCPIQYCTNCPAADVCKQCSTGYKVSDDEKKCLSCSISHCEQCSAHNVCQRCDPGYKLSPVDGQCYKCTMDNCAYCSADGFCAKCADNYKPANNNKDCFKCTMDNCIECSSHDKCGKCDAEYKPSPDDGKCYKCTMDNCNYCSSDSFCAKCAENYKPANNNKDCFQCTMPNCMECFDTEKCGTCNTDYKPSPDDGKCYKCTIENCNYCSSDGFCAECVTGHKTANNNKVCVECNIDNCVECIQSNKCGTCDEGYKPSADGECFPCTVSACKECSADGKCKACEDNYLPTDGKCYKCAMGNCNYCSSDGVCGQCADGYKPSNDNKNCYQCTMPHCMECSTHNVCKACADGYKLSNADGKCYQCAIANCNYCSSDGVCGECAADHKPTNGNTECFLCSMPQCTECHTDNLCKECAPGFKPSVDEGSCYTCTGDNCANCGTENNCQACDDGYTLTRHKRCVTCNLDNCQRCDASDVCVYCDDKHTVTDSGECVSCDLGNCTSCSSAGTCAMCVCGMVPTEDGKKCVDCAVANCRHCDVSGEGKKCAECIDKYVLTADRTCKAAGLPSWVIFMIVLGISIAIAIGSCLAISFYLRKLARQRQMEADAEERRQNRQAKGRAGRQHLKMAILDLGDIEGAASGVRDDATRQTLF